ncbi:MAG: glycosyltransferase family 2 protein [Chloroflexi bacterium]|nr:glycosyltransferase family 2 protein [Chloroflexota bacterium]
MAHGRRSKPSPITSLSYVVPAYNEEERLAESLQKLIAYAAAQPYSVDIIIVDDGSTDRTAEIANESIAELPDGVTARLISYQPNRGKGAAVRTGAQAATGDVILSLDADLAMPPEEMQKLLDALVSGADIAIGSRVKPGGGDMRASQPAWRRLGGRMFAVVRRRLLLSDIEDTQCGFKAFRHEAARALFPRQHLEGWAFDAEILYMAQRLGFRIAQVPVEWQHVEGSSFRLGVGSALREVRDLVRIRWLHRGLTPADRSS